MNDFRIKIPKSDKTYKYMHDNYPQFFWCDNNTKEGVAFIKTFDIIYQDQSFWFYGTKFNKSGLPIISCKMFNKCITEGLIKL